ncbi:MAG TPA: lipoyl(octanoyl) transferase LipB [Candidatus Limnocylindrales bacterium]|nr:lipoyl(octanoyl) transferase LipB [Candidatus Limnocylindrales bacterium]
MQECAVVDLGLIGYEAAWALQRRVVGARKLALVPDVLLQCEHPHVITLGRNGRRENLLAPEPLLRQMGVEFQSTNRGGDITYHGPGQLVAYPILNLAEIRRDVGWYVRQLEKAMIRVTAEYGIVAGRREGRTGVWVDVVEPDGARSEEKLGAIGVHISRWVTSHGLAYNVTTDLRYFDLIVPCGIADKRATSLERLLGRRVEMKSVKEQMARHLGECFGRAMRGMEIAELEEMLVAAEVAVSA